MIFLVNFSIFIYPLFSQFYIYLSEPKKNRIIFFSWHYLDCVGYYIDFEPRLWNLNDLASGFEYRNATFSFSIPADGKSHEIKLPKPPDDKE